MRGGLDLKAMSVDDLLTLRDQVNDTLSSRLESERRDLEQRLARLRKVDLARSRSKQSPVKGRKVTPKYRNPENATETWTGRGLQPRWLVAALKTGKKLSDFEIAGMAKTPSRTRRRKRAG